MKLTRIKIIKRFRSFLHRLKLPIIGLLLCGFWAIPISLISPKLFQLMVDQVFGSGRMSIFPILVGGFLLAFFLQVINDSLRLLCSNKIQNDFGYALRESILHKYFRIPYFEYSRYSTNELKMRSIDDVDRMGNFVQEQVVDVISGYVTVIVTVVICTAVNWKFLLLCLPVIPTMICIDKYIGKGTQNINEKLRNMNEEYGAFEHNVFTSWKEIKLQCAEAKTTETYREYRNKLSKLGLVYIRYWMYREVFNDFKANYLTKVFVYIIGAFLAIRGEISVGEIIMFGQYYEILFNATNTITQREVSFQINQPYYRRICETLDWTEENSLPVEREPALFPMEFHDVSFSYDGEHQVVKNVSFSVSEEDKIAVEGCSGIGKSTILSIALGLLKPQKGFVSYGGVPIEQWTTEDLYRHMGVVCQDGYLFNMSIRENLALSNAQLTDEELLNACRDAGIYDFVRELPQGLDTVIGEGGIKLSGGQRQRLLLARMLVKNPTFVFLDEATSAVDEETENHIVNSITAKEQKKTVFAISHKPTMQRKFMKTMVVDNQHVYEKRTEEVI